MSNRLNHTKIVGIKDLRTPTTPTIQDRRTQKMALTWTQQHKLIQLQEQQATTHTPKPPRRWGHPITILSLKTCKTCRKLTVCDTINRPKNCKQKGGKN